MVQCKQMSQGEQSCLTPILTLSWFIRKNDLEVGKGRINMVGRIKAQDRRERVRAAIQNVDSGHKRTYR